MNPPSVPRSMMTPARDMREGSVASSVGGSSRKPRQNLDERDHILMVKHCVEQKGNYKEGTKAQFWTGVNTAFQKDTGKILAQMSATVGRLVEARRRQISDWESGAIPQKPAGELNDLLDQWIEFLKVEDGDAEEERMRQVDARRKVEEARKEARRQAIAAEQAAAALNPQAQQYPPAPPDGSQQQHPQQQAPPGQQMSHLPPSQYHPPPPPGQMVVANGEHDINGYNRPHKRKRANERAMTRELQDQIQQEQAWHAQQQQQQQQYALQHPPTPPRRVVVEGALSKEDWRDIMGNDARLRTLESKVDKIELLVSQNNKLLLQLLQNQNQPRERSQDRDHHDHHDHDEDRVPVSLDADFERDYL